MNTATLERPDVSPFSPAVQRETEEIALAKVLQAATDDFWASKVTKPMRNNIPDSALTEGVLQLILACVIARVQDYGKAHCVNTDAFTQHLDDAYALLGEA